MLKSAKAIIATAALLALAVFAAASTDCCKLKQVGDNIYVFQVTIIEVVHGMLKCHTWFTVCSFTFRLNLLSKLTCFQTKITIRITDFQAKPNIFKN